MCAAPLHSIENRASFDHIRYANCWEDADILCRALQPSPGKRYLSIASGGDNSFALLAEGSEVIAADLSPAQLALVELKAAAIRRMDRDEVLEFLGVHDSDRRPSVFEMLRPDLPESSRRFWDQNPRLLATGVIHHGRFERYFRLFRTRVLPWIHDRRTIVALMARRDEAARREFYERRWDNLRWRLLFRVFFSRFVMGRMGRDPEFFRYVEGSVADRILERTRYALTVLPTDSNPYLEYILTGNFERALPRYLRPRPFADLKRNLHGLTLVHGTVQDAAARAGGRFDGFNLSDIFEYLDRPSCRSIYGELLQYARLGARLAYWNMLAPRSCPEAHRGRVRSLDEEARRLFAEDRAFFYSAFVLEQVA